MSVKSTALTIVLASAFALGGCSHQSSSGSPTAPSAVSPAAAPTSGITGSATISGTVSGASGGASAAWAPRSIGGLTITVSGTNVTATADGSGHFVLPNVPSGTVTLHFAGSGVDATLTIADVATNDRIQLTIEISGSSASLADEEHDGHDSRSELEGAITAIDRVAGTLTVRGTIVTVPAGTPIRHGGATLTFADLIVGERVHIKGTRQGSGVVASEVNVQDVQAAPPPEQTEAHGTVSALAGTCPALTFTVGTTTVVTTAGTQFKKGACSTIANGTSVDVQGTMQGTTLSATEVEAQTEDQEADVHGTVRALSGTCPALTFTVGTTTVVTTAGTQFKKGACSTVVNGTSVDVQGTMQGTTLSATEVEAQTEDQEADVHGSVSALTGTCPTLAFKVGSTSVVTTAATEFKGASCASLANGASVEVKGTRATTGIVTAARVQTSGKGN